MAEGLGTSVDEAESVVSEQGLDPESKDPEVTQVDESPMAQQVQEDEMTSNSANAETPDEGELANQACIDSSNQGSSVTDTSEGMEDRMPDAETPESDDQALDDEASGVETSESDSQASGAETSESDGYELQNDSPQTDASGSEEPEDQIASAATTTSSSETRTSSTASDLKVLSAATTAATSSSSKTTTPFARIYKRNSTPKDASKTAALLRIKGTNLVFAYAGATAKSGAVLQLNAPNNKIMQRFLLSSAGKGAYRIVAAENNDLVLSSKALKKGQKLFLASISKQLIQTWRFVADDSGRFYRIVCASNSTLGIGVTSAKAGAQIVLQDTKHMSETALSCATPTLKSGIYEFRSKQNEKVALDVAGGTAANNKNVQLWKKNNSFAQRFILKWNPRVGYYRIASAVSSGYVLDASDGGVKSGANVRLYNQADSFAQYWTIRPCADSKGYEALSAKSGLQLGMPGNRTEAATNVALYSYSNKAARGWLVKGEAFNYPASSGVTSSPDKTTLWRRAYRKIANSRLLTSDAVILKLAGQGLVLDMRGGNVSVGTAVQAYGANDTIAQRFSLVSCGNGVYRITSALSGNVLQPKSAKAGAMVELSKPSSSALQKWSISYDANAKGYRFVNLANKQLVLGFGSTAKRGSTLVAVKGSSKNSASFVFMSPCESILEDSYTVANKKNKSLVAEPAARTVGSGTNANLGTNQKSSSWQHLFFDWDPSVGYYVIASNSSRRYVLDVKGGSKSSGANVRFWRKNNTAAQYWFVRILADRNGHEIIAAASGLQLGVKNNSAVNKANLAVYKKTNDTSRSWLLGLETSSGQKSTSASKLKIPTNWYGKGESYQAYHPKVVAFTKSWNGYRYWMAYTPYPNHDSSYEDPCICASNDMVHWVVPKRLRNPIDDMHNDGTSLRYNSDTHLLYNKDTKSLELFWRRKDYDTYAIYRATSKNGTTWSASRKVISNSGIKHSDALSPAVMYENGLYRMWYVADGNGTIHYTESKDCKTWKRAQEIAIPFKQTSLKTWHLDVEKTSKGYEALLSAADDYSDHSRMCLWHSTSKNGITKWSTPTVVLKPSSGTSAWDSKGIYRSCLLYESGRYYVFYSGISHPINGSSTYGLGLASGQTMSSLKRMLV